MKVQFKSKATVFILLILIICLLLVSYFYLINNSQSDDNLSENYDVVYIWMEDDEGNIKLIPTTNTYSEGSASAPD